MKDFKIKCVSSNIPPLFTVGETYEVTDDCLPGNDGYVFGNNRFSSVDDLNSYSAFAGKFVFEKVEESKMFTKDDLKVNDWCIFRNGDVRRIAEIEGERHIVGYDFWNPISQYARSLEVNDDNFSEWDIVKVVRPIHAYQLRETEKDSGSVVFDRKLGIGCEPPVKEISVEEATKLLTEKFGQNVRIRVDE